MFVFRQSISTMFSRKNANCTFSYADRFLRRTTPANSFYDTNIYIILHTYVIMSRSLFIIRSFNAQQSWSCRMTSVRTLSSSTTTNTTINETTATTSTTATDTSSTTTSTSSAPRVVVLGTGWGGFNLVRLFLCAFLI